MKIERAPLMVGRHVGGTILRILSRPFKIEVRITSDCSRRTRRQIGLLFFRHLKPAFEVIEHAELYHDDTSVLDFFSHYAREVKETQACSAEDARGKLGSGIRIKRLNSGLSQEDLAQRCGMTRCALSRIEKGYALPRMKTLLKIQDVLGKVEPFSPKPPVRDRRHRIKSWLPKDLPYREPVGWATESD